MIRRYFKQRRQAQILLATSVKNQAVIMTALRAIASNLYMGNETGHPHNDDLVDVIKEMNYHASRSLIESNRMIDLLEKN